MKNLKNILINGWKKILKKNPDFRYIFLPTDRGRCIEILTYFTGECPDIFEEKDWKYAYCDKRRIYFSRNLPEEGVGEMIQQIPTILPLQEVIHFRSGRVEVIKGTALLKTDSGWKEAVIYGDGVKTFVRELENFKEAFINKK